MIQHGHPSSVQKEFTVLTNVLPSRKIQKAAALKKHCNHKLYLYKNHCSEKTLILQELYAHQNCTESTKTQESLF